MGRRDEAYGARRSIADHRARIARATAAPIGIVLCALAIVAPPDAHAEAADDPPPTISVSARNTIDVWGVADGGKQRGVPGLNKLQVAATLAGDGFGMPGLTLHAQIFRTDGESLSARLGDIQTADNIEAPAVTRLFEAWIAQRFGHGRALSLRAGLIDLNSDFDSIDTASLFLSSSHGIAPDLSKSGLAGPSIFPVTSLGAEFGWQATPKLALHVAAFDGVSGDPARPNAFAAARLSRDDGVLTIGQLDYAIGKSGQIELGLWRYSHPMAAIDPGIGTRRDQGAYVSIDTPIPGTRHWDAWGRIGVANGQVQLVSDYIGAGIVRTAPFAGRPDDRVGIAIARAGIAEASRRLSGLHHAETSIEATYQFRLNHFAVLQPDVQYIFHPSAEAGVANALAFGLRLVVEAGIPKGASSREGADPTVAPGSTGRR